MKAKFKITILTMKIEVTIKIHFLIFNNFDQLIIFPQVFGLPNLGLLYLSESKEYYLY